MGAATDPPGAGARGAATETSPDGSAPPDPADPKPLTEASHSAIGATPADPKPLTEASKSAIGVTPADPADPQPVTGPAAPETGTARLLGPAEVRALAAELGLRPTKRLGQNFVHDPNTVRRIVRSAALAADDVVLEVGPGLGSLTLGLLEAAAAVTAVEIDPVLAARLPLTVRDRAPAVADRLTVLATDALRIGATDLPQPPTALVANLPYNVGVPVVLHLLAALPTVARGLVMVQAEVAERLAAPPGSRAYGVPSAKLAWFAAARRAGPVPRTVFWPVPNVDSGLLAFTRHAPPSGDRSAVFALVDAAFAQRRKVLRSALAGWAGSPARAEEILRAAGVDPATRAERLAIADFARIAAQVPRTSEP